MHVTRIVATLAALTLGLSVASCSLTVGGSSEDSPADSSQPAAAETTDVTAPETTDAPEPDPTITDADWLAALEEPAETVSGDHTISMALSTYNLTGDLDSLTVEGAMNTVAAEHVGTLTVSGADTVVYALSVEEIVMEGTGITVYYLTGEPVVTDSGIGNRAVQLEQ